MKYGIIFLSLLIASAQSHSQMYKCVEPGVKISYSDMPCVGATQVELVSTTYQKSWQSRLKLQKPSGVTIEDIQISADETLIKFKFQATSQSNKFMRIIDKLSSQNVSMMKIKLPKGKNVGRGQIKVSLR